MTNYHNLVRKYEPVLAFSMDGKQEQEVFFPMSVEDYVARCGLWHKGCEILTPTPKELLVV